MALLGSSVDPRLFMQDYSGFTRAADIQAQGMQNLGAAIGQGIKGYGEIVGERKKTDAQIKADDVSIESAIKLGKSLGIDINSYLEPIQALRKDPNTTPAESLALGRAAAQGISNAFTLGIGAQEREIAAQRAKAEAGYKQGMLGAAQTRAAASLFSAKQAAGELKETEISIFDPEIGKERKEKALIDKQGQYYEPDTKRPILNKEKFFYGEEGGLGELPPTSQVGGNTSDLIASAAGMPAFTSKTRDQLPPSSVKNRYLSLDFNAASNLNARGIEVIVPDSATPEEFAAARRYAKNTQAYFAKHNVNVPIRGKDGVKTTSENKRGSGKIIHLEPAFGADKEAIAVMQKDPEGYAQVISDSFAGLPVTVIAPHKQNDPGAVVNGISERGLATDVLIPAFERLSQQRISQANPTAIDNALSMSGGVGQQAMGTPEQQAEAARQIEQGQQLRLATAQNVTQGAVPTEPSIATQQPQLPQPQRRMVRGIPADGGKAAPIKMTAEQVQNLVSQGFKVDGIPSDGGFMVSGVTAGGQTPRYTKTPEEDLQSQRLTTLDKEQADLRSAGLSESQNIAQLKGIKDLLDSSVKTGFGRETIMKARRVLGKDVANEEQFGSLVGNEAMKNIALTKGAISDREMEYFKTVLSPNMGKTTEGNKKILDFRIKFAERASKIAKTITKMQSQGKSPFDVQSEIDNIIASEPLFSTSDANGTPQNQTQSDVDFLNAYPSTKGYPSGE